jgi:LPS-assembly lipoprotein
MNRRALLGHGLLIPAGLALAGLGGCGFALKRVQPLPFRSMALQGFAGNSGMAIELARTLDAAGVAVVETSAQAAALASPNEGQPLAGHLIFEALNDQQEQTAASTTAYRQIRDMGLRTRLRFRVLRADGSVLLAPTDLQLSRILPYNEKDALARQDEFESIHKAMQTDLIEQVMRRLATLKP